MRQDRESGVQRAIVAYLRRVLPDAIVHHSPNEGVRGGRDGYLDGAFKKSAGQVAGFPDLIVIPWAHIGPLFLEVKSASGRLSEAQAVMLDRLATLGYRVAVVRSIDDVRARLAEWGIATREAGGWQSIGGVAG